LAPAGTFSGMGRMELAKYWKLFASIGLIIPAFPFHTPRDNSLSPGINSLLSYRREMEKLEI
jgi:hypothetical protein